MQKLKITHYNFRAIEWTAVLEAVWIPALLWVMALIIPTLVGIPGIICLTPLGWLSSIRIGRHAAELLKETNHTSQTLSLGIAGALYGLIQGVLFVIVYTYAPTAYPEDKPLKLIVNLVMFLLSISASAFLANWAGKLRKRQLESKNAELYFRHLY